ncbi:MAG: FtsH protease activity modulator HflK [Planctomycetes bacterium]|nr:FtsH protease activity modulator HflK [Planctomycetota bacterium]
MTDPEPQRKKQPGEIRRPGRTVIRAITALLLLAYLCSGICVIRPNEAGVVRRFGRVAFTVIDGKPVPEILQPGLHYRLPWPITRLNRVRPTETRTITVGYQPADSLLGRPANPAASEFLTGDQNIMRLRMSVQYTLGNPIAFLFGARDPVVILRTEAESCLTRAVSSVNVDDLVGAARVTIANDVRAELEREMALHQPGIRVTAVNLLATSPPREVAEAFYDVQSAKAEKERLIHQAEADRENRIRAAEAQADALLNDAGAYRHDRVEVAKGEAERFDDLYGEYKQAKEVTALRLYIEAMEEVLPKLKKVIVDSDDKGGPVDLGIIESKP